MTEAVRFSETLEPLFHELPQNPEDSNLYRSCHENFRYQKSQTSFSGLWTLTLIHSITCQEGTVGELRYGSTISLTSALDGGMWLTPSSCCITPRITRYPFCRKLGGPKSQSGWVRKVSPPPGIRSLNCAAGTGWLYRLSCPGNFKTGNSSNTCTINGDWSMKTWLF